MIDSHHVFEHCLGIDLIQKGVRKKRTNIFALITLNGSPIMMQNLYIIMIELS
jgi:hypothetical protein